MKYVIDDTTMTGLADAIREKASSTFKMTPAEMIATIANLPAGDGTFAQGSFIPEADMGMLYSQYSDEAYTIEHGLGKVPNLVTVWAEITAEESYIPTSASFYFAILMPNTYRCCYLMRTYNTSGGTSIDISLADSPRPVIRVSENDIKIGSSNRCYLRAGRKYYWAVANVDITR